MVTAFLDAIARRDADAVAACVTDDFVNEHTSNLGETVVGRDAYRQRLDGFLERFRELRYEPERIIADGDAVAVPYRMTARWVDDGGGEHPVDLRGAFVFDVRGDRIARRVDYWDSAAFLEQVR